MASRLSIRARIALYGSLVVALTLVLVGVLVYLLASLGGREDRDDALQRRADEAAAALAAAPPEDFTTRRAPAPIEIDRDDVFVAILDASGATIVSTGEVVGAVPTFPADLLSAAADGVVRRTIALAPGLDVRVIAVPWSRPDLGRSGFVVAGQSTDRLRTDQNAVAVFVAIAAFIGLAAAFGASWRVAGRALRPLREMAATADEIGATEDLSRRLPHPGGTRRPRDEIGRLTASFNGMLGRLEETHRHLTDTLRREQRFVADASHELRTPITSIRANADFLLSHPDARPDDRRAAVADIAAESEQMSRLVHDLLLLARADAGLAIERTCVELLPLCSEVGRQAHRLYPEREVHLILDPGTEPGDVTVAGDAAALRQLVWILIENALKNGGAPDGQPARAWLCLGARADCVLIRVADDGVGIPEADLERIFERFYQADPARSGGGAGLGLAIARWIVATHDGRIWARNNDGPGASFFVELPQARGVLSPES